MHLDVEALPNGAFMSASFSGSKQSTALSLARLPGDFRSASQLTTPFRTALIQPAYAYALSILFFISS
jgi:hypothetical protein